MLTSQQLFDKHYPEGTKARDFLYVHSLKVMEAALKIAEHNMHLNPDLEVIAQSALLHDIGIMYTNAPEIGCTGHLPYLAHGYMGRALLEKEGFEKIAPVCERHIGVGLSKRDIIEHNMPLPQRDMLPITVEEKIVCYADKFYSKSKVHKTTPKSYDKIRVKIAKYGRDKIKRFDEFVEMFGINYLY